jgi:hypothetical protein
MAEFKPQRRYYLSKWQAANAACDLAIASLWKSKQLAEPGAALPDGFPSKDKLELAGYVADADLFGADECELTRATGISTSQATAVLTALAGL